MSFAEKVESKNRYAFTISYQGTDENAITHNRFKKLSEQYDNVYISTLRVLLDSFDERQDLNCVLELIGGLERQVVDLREEVRVLREQPKKKSVGKTFGKKEEE